MTQPGEVRIRRALLSVSDKTGIVDFARGLAELGERQLVEVVTLVGHYCLIGFIANGFDVQPPDGSPPSF